MPVKTMGELPILQPYNPLDKRRLGEQVAEALLDEDVHPLPPQKFIGPAYMHSIT